ncbi:uncharacterized protein PHACADRAFT_206169 [Phanerochaete carnosa HHB-10118-sp]|uniref:Glucose-methanol-choline oxidoreductase C-terminal domain-containing protein n=1 Tax=Phanerochaete carnosa (strain HHB-10118-sp) TaxID=650164 RepID=K5XAK0_PHACS|nr:uncharacterized protein PHACADRAFT_206169 [Phanerochaete carnosa HHB-10118-sp]EKM59952.1 hypothetical protein PHACADRAFT_206169 [Phanerochaete carnosa HHB-10118-sp]
MATPQSSSSLTSSANRTPLLDQPTAYLQLSDANLQKAKIVGWKHMVDLGPRCAHIPALNLLLSEDESNADEVAVAWLKKTFSITWHTAGSCWMTPREENGVLDTDLKVHGTSYLRVVDLSIDPPYFASHQRLAVYAKL